MSITVLAVLAGVHVDSADDALPRCVEPTGAAPRTASANGPT